jgi:hypothetical protein
VVRRLAAQSAIRRRISAKVPAGMPGGDYRVLVCADDTRRVREVKERNNCRAATGVLRIVPAVAGAPTPETVSQPAPASEPAPTPTPSPASAPVEAKAADADGDGTPDASDCPPQDAVVHPGAPDAPDLDGVDTNCDGLDGNPRGVDLRRCQVRQQSASAATDARGGREGG